MCVCVCVCVFALYHYFPGEEEGRGLCLKTPKDVRFSGPACFYQFLSLFLLFLGAGNNSALNFESNGSNFWCLNKLLCCYAANQHSESTCIFPKFFQKSAVAIKLWMLNWPNWFHRLDVLRTIYPHGRNHPQSRNPQLSKYLKPLISMK